MIVFVAKIQVYVKSITYRKLEHRVLGIILFQMIPFTFAAAELLEFEKIVYEDRRNDGSSFSFYENVEYVEKSGDSSLAKNLKCSHR